MRTTSEKLTYLNTTKTLIKDNLNLGGANISNEPFRVYSSKLIDIYKDFLANGTDVVWNNWLPKVTGSGETITLNNTIEAKMDFVYKGNTSQTGTPTPDTPIPVQVVSGDNTIKVEGKNLVNLSSLATETSNGITLTPVFEDNKLQYININGTSTALTVFSLTTYTTTTNNVLNGCFGGSSSTYKLDFWTSGNLYANFNNEDTQLPNNSLGTLRIVVYSGKTVNNVKIYPMISTSGGKYQPYKTPQTYPISLGDIELCKIGDYQDKIAKSTGKNLFDKDNVVGGFVNADGSVGGDTNAYRTSDFIPIQPNTAYYKTSTESPRTKYYDSNKQPLNTTTYQDILIGGNAGTFTTPNNAYYLRFSYPVSSVNANSIMINEGATALPYEPYGKVWYLNKQIGKVVLDGSENWSAFASVNYEYQLSLFAGLSTDTSNQYFPALCNKYINHNVAGSSLSNYEFSHFSTQPSTVKERFVRFRNNDITTLANWKTELQTNNAILYVPLATPTTTEITDTTLISQLEAIKKSYNTQTNISQENNDLPFELDVVALGKLS